MIFLWLQVHLMCVHACEWVGLGYMCYMNPSNIILLKTLDLQVLLKHKYMCLLVEFNHFNAISPFSSRMVCDTWMWSFWCNWSQISSTAVTAHITYVTDGVFPTDNLLRQIDFIILVKQIVQYSQWWSL